MHRSDGNADQSRSSGDTSGDFSVVLGGPLYQLWLRARIVKPPLDLLARRIIVITLIAWLPPFLLAVISGRAWNGAKVPMLFDVATNVRLLVALPLLIYAEWLVHYRIR